MSGRRQAKGGEGPGWTSAYFAKPWEMEFSGDKLIALGFGEVLF